MAKKSAETFFLKDGSIGEEGKASAMASQGGFK